MIEGLPARIQYLRQSLKLTQTEAEQQLGLPRKAISAYETGNRVPTVELVVKMAALYRTTTDYILGVSHLETIALDDLSPSGRKAVRHIIELTITAVQTFESQQHAADQ